MRRRLPDYNVNAATNLKILESRKRGRPKTRWTDNIAKDLMSCNVYENDMSNRAKWGGNTRKQIPPPAGNNNAEEKQRVHL